MRTATPYKQEFNDVPVILLSPVGVGFVEERLKGVLVFQVLKKGEFCNVVVFENKQE